MFIANGVISGVIGSVITARISREKRVRLIGSIQVALDLCLNGQVVYYSCLELVYELYIAKLNVFSCKKLAFDGKKSNKLTRNI